MSEPTRDYSFITAITPEEIKAMGDIKRGDSAWASESSIWLDPLSRDYNDAWKPESGPVRRPIDPDPSMPDGQKRWEIVPPNAIETKKMQYFCNGKWKRNRLIRGREVGYYVVCDILAFRRPITPALKEAGAGSLEEKPKPMFAGNTRALVDKITALHSELTHLHTLAKDQGEALEKAEEAFNTILSDFKKRGECRSNFSDGEYTQDYTTRYELINNTLTLIAKLKGEVGE